MQFVSAITQKESALEALSELTIEVRKSLSELPHLVFLFVSPDYETAWEEAIRSFRHGLGNPILIGCSSSGVIGNDLELEFRPAMSLVAARLPEVLLHPFTVSPIELELSGNVGKRWTTRIGVSREDHPSFILIPEPYTCDAMKLVHDLNEGFSERPVIGGLASGATEAGQNFLFLNDEVIREGAVGLALTGNISLDTIVSQGCRPIGERFVITKADENALLELGGKFPVDVLQELFGSLSLRDRVLAQHSLFLGVVMDEMRSEFGRGDFLIRNIIGADPTTGALIIGDRLSVGQTVQFHLRDAKTSEEDLRTLLESQLSSLKSDPPRGMLLFSCQGRGRGLYGKPNHDIQMIRSVIGPSAIAGFFCNGEIGPVGGKTYLHGYTSSLGIFREKQTNRKEVI